MDEKKSEIIKTKWMKNSSTYKHVIEIFLIIYVSSYSE